MKRLKQDDGYVLVYVLIVFAVLSLVAGVITSTALKNLQTQQADVVRAEARYEAEGYLQQFIAEVAALTATGTAGPVTDPTAAHDAAVSNMEAIFCAQVQELGDSLQLTLDDASAPDSWIVQATSSDGTAEIVAVLAVELDSTTTGGEIEESEYPQYAYTCNLNQATVSAYDSYDISYLTPEDGGEEGDA